MAFGVSAVRRAYLTLFFLVPWVQAAGQTGFLYGIHDYEPRPDGFLQRLERAGVRGAVTATEAVGHDPNDRSGKDYTAVSSRGFRVIARLNNGYYPNGTIPLPERWDAFARRCANFVAASRGCNTWVIGNETNLAGEWPQGPDGYRRYISPEAYAECFRRVYDRIKAVRPSHEVIPQALAPFAGPYGGTREHDGMPLDHVTYMRRMLTAIADSGAMDGIAIHVNSRGYGLDDVFSTAKVNGNFWSFFCYRDWLERGTPRQFWDLPVYATECNGYYYWKGGHAEAPERRYEPGWVPAVLLEIDRWNHNEAIIDGKPIIRSLCFYRWCSFCDGWNIDGSPQEDQILADLEEAAAYRLSWPERGEALEVPCSVTVEQRTPPLQKDREPYYGVWRSYVFWVPGASALPVAFELRGTARSGADDDDARLLVDDDSPTDDASWNTGAALDGSRDNGRPAVARFTRSLGPGRHVLRLQVDHQPYIERVDMRLPGELFRRGEVNDDEVVDLSDAVCVLLYLFGEGRVPRCLDAADANDGGTINVADALAILNYLFREAAALPPPGTCGIDPTGDSLPECAEAGCF